MNAGVAEVAAIGIKPLCSQHADVVASASPYFEDCVTFLAKGADVVFDDIAASAMPIVKLIPWWIGFIILIAAKFSPSSVVRVR
jgi:hypothetical protein